MEKKVYYNHLTDKNGRRFTIAGTIDENMDLFVLGISICDEKDNFSRSIGRNISRGRCESKPGTRGRHVVSLYDTLMPENYWKGIENKVFFDKIKNFAEASVEDLKKEFRLNTPRKKSVQKV